MAVICKTTSKLIVPTAGGRYSISVKAICQDAVSWTAECQGMDGVVFDSDVNPTQFTVLENHGETKSGSIIITVKGDETEVCNPYDETKCYTPIMQPGTVTDPDLQISISKSSFGTTGGNAYVSFVSNSDGALTYEIEACDWLTVSGRDIIVPDIGESTESRSCTISVTGCVAATEYFREKCVTTSFTITQSARQAPGIDIFYSPTSFDFAGGYINISATSTNPETTPTLSGYLEIGGNRYYIDETNRVAVPEYTDTTTNRNGTLYLSASTVQTDNYLSGFTAIEGVITQAKKPQEESDYISIVAELYMKNGESYTRVTSVESGATSGKYYIKITGLAVLGENTPSAQLTLTGNGVTFTNYTPAQGPYTLNPISIGNEIFLDFTENNGYGVRNSSATICGEAGTARTTTVLEMPQLGKDDIYADISFQEGPLISISSAATDNVIHLIVTPNDAPWSLDVNAGYAYIISDTDHLTHLTGTGNTEIELFIERNETEFSRSFTVTAETTYNDDHIHDDSAVLNVSQAKGVSNFYILNVYNHIIYENRTETSSLPPSANPIFKWEPELKPEYECSMYIEPVESTDFSHQSFSMGNVWDTLSPSESGRFILINDYYQDKHTDVGEKGDVYMIAQRYDEVTGIQDIKKVNLFDYYHDQSVDSNVIKISRDYLSESNPNPLDNSKSFMLTFSDYVIPSDTYSFILNIHVETSGELYLKAEAVNTGSTTVTTGLVRIEFSGSTSDEPTSEDWSGITLSLVDAENLPIEITPELIQSNETKVLFFDEANDGLIGVTIDDIEDALGLNYGDLKHVMVRIGDESGVMAVYKYLNKVDDYWITEDTI